MQTEAPEAPKPAEEYIPPVRAHGVRLGLVEAEEELSSTIIIPNVAKGARDKRLARVFSKGPDAKYVEEGDTVMFQIPKTVTQSSTYRLALNKKPFLFVHHDDVIAKCTTSKFGRDGGAIVGLDGFHVVGRWLLLNMETNIPKGIVLPEKTPVSLSDIRFTVLQIGNGVEKPPYKVGDEIFVERTRVNPILIDGVEYGWLDSANVYGVRDESLGKGTGEIEEPSRLIVP